MNAEVSDGGNFSASDSLLYFSPPNQAPSPQCPTLTKNNVESVSMAQMSSLKWAALYVLACAKVPSA